MRVLIDRAKRDLSRLELAVTAAVAAVVVGILLTKLSGLMVEVERAAFTVRLNNLRSALMMEIASRMTGEARDSIAQLDGQNPMAILGLDPADYLGALNEVDPASIQRGAWYFDVREGVLVYRVKNDKYFETDLPGAKRARFAIRLDFVDVNANGVYDPASDRVYGARLRPIEPYAWISPYRRG